MRLAIAIFVLGVVLGTWTSPVRGASEEMPLSRFELQGGKAPLPARVLALPQGIGSLSVSECEGCHVAEAREWQGSQHRQSWTSALFQEAYRIEPMPECRNCHQPLTAGKAPTEAVKQLRDEGITCAVCHVRDGSILAPQRSGRAPHAVAEAPVMAESAFCGGCHQFNFPDRRPERHDGAVHQTSEPMQDTLGEWQRLRVKGAMPQTCQDCHMPIVSGPATAPPGLLRHRSHRFAGGYDQATLQRAVAVAVELSPAPPAAMSAAAAFAELRVHLAAQEAGHAVPTGDLYRSIVIEARALDEAGKAIGAQQEQRLQRHFISTVESDESGRPRVQRRQCEDDRLVPGHPQELRFRLPAGTRLVQYRVSLSRLPPGAKASTATSISLIAEGQVSVAPSGSGGPGKGVSL